MVVTGRRSDGCTNCRRSKKGCDQKRPTCGRCFRLQQACYGYKYAGDRRQMPEPVPLSLSNPYDPDQKLLQLFHRHFCTDEYQVLEQFTHNHIVRDLMLSCSLIISTNKEDMEKTSIKIILLYVQALQELRAALADQQRVKEDVTLVSAIVICILERVNPLGSSLSCDWNAHFKGLSQIVCGRGLSQIQTTQGRAIFRLARRMILEDAIRRQEAAPLFIISCTQGLKSDPVYDVIDKLAILTTRLSILREHVKNGILPADKIIAASQNLRDEFEAFGQQYIPDAIQAQYLVHSISDRNVSSLFGPLNITTHTLDFRSLFVEWQVYLGLITELGDVHSDTPTQTERSSFYGTRSSYLRYQQRMAFTISLRAMCLLDSVAQIDVPKGWITIVLRLVGPLYFAGLWLQREHYTPDRDIFQDTMAPIYGMGCFPLDVSSVQLEYIIEVLKRIADRLCDHYAKEAVGLLTVTGP